MNTIIFIVGLVSLVISGLVVGGSYLKKIKDEENQEDKKLDDQLEKALEETTTKEKIDNLTKEINKQEELVVQTLQKMLESNNITVNDFKSFLSLHFHYKGHHITIYLTSYPQKHVRYEVPTIGNGFSLYDQKFYQKIKRFVKQIEEKNKIETMQKMQKLFNEEDKK